MVRRVRGGGLECFTIGELIGVVESPNSKSEEHADDPETDPDTDEMLDTEENRRGVWGRAASRGDVLRGSPLVRRGVVETGGDVGESETRPAGVEGSSTICTCGNILELVDGKIASSRENEIGIGTCLQNINERGLGIRKLAGRTHHSVQLRQALLLR